MTRFIAYITALSAEMKKEAFFKGFSFLFLTESLITLFTLLLVPSEEENRCFWLYSENKMILIAVALFFSLLFTAVLFLQKKRSGFLNKLIIFLLHPLIFTFTICISSVSLLSLIRSFLTFYNRFDIYYVKTRPLLFLIFLLFSQSLLIQVWLSNGEIFRETKKTFADHFKCIKRFIELSARWLVKWLGRKNNALLVTLLVLSPFFFLNNLRFEYPVGGAGLFSLMADEIIQNGFRLPVEVPYYGPGGIPFSYPPLGFYVMAIFMRFLHVPALIYMRFAPAVFSLLALVPLFLISREISGSNLAAFISALVIASSSWLYVVHTFSAGLVRALAYFLSLLALYFFLRQTQSSHWKNILLSGLFFGLTVLTHLGYAQFVALVVFTWVLVHPRLKNWLSGGGVAVSGTLVALPWIITVARHHSISVFQGAFSSHGNDYFLHVFKDFDRLFPWIAENMRHISHSPVLYGAIFLAALYLISRKKFSLPVIFLVLLIFTSEGDRYLITIASLMVGILFNLIYRQIVRVKEHAHVFQGFVFLIITSILFSYSGFSEILTYRPSIDEDSLHLSTHMEGLAEKESTYLLVTNDIELAEMFPYLSRHEPLVGSWGGEWIDTYSQHVGLLLEVVDCNDRQDYTCLLEVFNEVEAYPDLLVTYFQQESLNSQIHSSSDWQVGYENSEFILWQNIKSTIKTE